MKVFAVFAILIILSFDSQSRASDDKIQFNFTINSYDWGRRKIDRPAFPNGPYDPDSNYQVIKIENAGSQDVIIRNFVIISDINGSAFEFDRSALINRVIPDSSNVLIPVKFHPKNPGLYELIFGLDNTAQSVAKCTLRGIGIVPKTKTYDVDFGSTIIDNFKNPNIRKVRFVNPDSSEWKFGDTLIISDFTIQPIGNEIGLDSNWGTEGFRFDKSALNFPIKLAQGEYVEFNAEFVANKVVETKASLVSLSDSDSLALSKWTGTGIVQGIRVIADTVTTCFNDEIILECKIWNIGSGDLSIDSLDIQPLDSQSVGKFSFVNPADKIGFALTAGAFKKIYIRFKTFWNSYPFPDSMTFKANLLAHNNSIFTPVAVSETPMIVYIQHQYVITRLELSKDSVTIGDIIDGRIILLPGSDISPHNIDKLNIILKYNPGFIQFLKNEIQIEGILKGKFSIDSVTVNDSSGEAKISLSSLSHLYNFPEGGELVNFKFQIMMPKDTSTISFIEHDMFHHLCPCLDKICENPAPIKLTNFNSKVKIITLNNKEYGIKDIVPNPVYGGNFNLEFSIGQKGTTIIRIFNSTGQTTFYSEFETLIPGVFSTTIDVSQLSIGAYWLDIISGNYHDTKMFIVK